MHKTITLPFENLFRGILKTWLPILIFSSLANYASAHGIKSSDLRGATLCLEPRSVQVSKRGDALPDDAYFQTVAEHLYRVLTDTLTNFKVPYRERARCQDTESFTVILFHLQGRSDSSGKASYLLASSTQVGQTPPPGNIRPNQVLPQLRFDAYLEQVYRDVTDRQALFDELPKTNEEMIRDLAISWWQDYNALNETSEGPVSVSLIVLSTVLTVAAALSALVVTKRLKRARLDRMSRE
ncbi:MAG: hypothetical protein JSV66_16750 [Trueperaceae bacterium]|nr:MAG: hypothetical protein JSV66_16750 [Trueperaceae bacterium]